MNNENIMTAREANEHASRDTVLLEQVMRYVHDATMDGYMETLVYVMERHRPLIPYTIEKLHGLGYRINHYTEDNTIGVEWHNAVPTSITKIVSQFKDAR